GDELGHLRAHGGEGDVLLCLDGPGDAPGVMLGEEAPGHLVEEIEVEPHREREDQHGDEGVAQYPAERDPVEAEESLEGALTAPVGTAMALLATPLEEHRA